LKITYHIRQTSTLRNSRMYLFVLIQQIVVLLIFSQDKKSKRCLVNIFLKSILF
jgi:hypothetical protein